MRLPPGIGVRDLLGIGFLTGIGFTVSLLMAELSFGGGYLASAKASVLLGSCSPSPQERSRCAGMPNALGLQT
jgi:Na+/H+ antiporter NhaA